MPLLKMDALGNIYEEGFGDERRLAEITPEDGNVMLGEYDPRALKKRRIAEMKKKLLAKKKALQAQKVRKAQAAKQAAQKKREAAIKQEMHRRVVAERNKKAAAYVQGVAKSRDAMTGQFQNLSEAKKGFDVRTKQIPKKVLNRNGDYGVVDLASGSSHWGPRSRFNHRPLKLVSRFQNTEHPLSGFGAMGEPMGFKIKIKAPKIKIKTPKLSQVIGKQADKLVSKAVKEVGKGAAAVYKAPLQVGNAVLTQTPLVKDVYKGVDKLTGGTLTSLHRTAMLPGKALEGKPVSKAELLEGVINVVKVGAIVVSGGSAVALIGAASGALKQGPLGKTALGNTLLSIGEVAGLAYGAGQGLSKALEKKAIDVAAQKAGTEVGKKAGPIASIAASIAVQAGAAGAQNPGSKVPNAATASGAASTAQAANNAAAKAAEQVQKSMKFSTDAAMAEAKKLAAEQAKALVAKEFKQRTGIPLDIASQVAQGKVPSADQLKQKLVSDLKATPDHLKSELAKIADQRKNAEPLMRKVLDEKEKILEREIVQRARNIEKVKEMGAKELVEHNTLYKAKAEVFAAKVDVMKKTADEARRLREQAQNIHTNFEEKERLSLQASDLENKLLAMKNDVEPLGDEVAALSIKSEQIKEDNAARLAIAEFGGQTKWTPASEAVADINSGVKRHELVHPMLSYGLV